MKKIMFVLSIIMVVSMLASCGAPATTAPATAAPATTAPAQPATAAPAKTAPATAAPAAAVYPKVTLAIGADPGDMGPFVGMSMGRIAILKTTYEYLVEADTMGSPAVPMLAKSVDKKDDKTYDVTLFDYISDSAGNHITAADVAWSYNTDIASGMARPLGDVQSVTATGDYTVEFVFKKVLGVGDLDKILSECPIVSQKAYEASADKFATDPITTGPYVLKKDVPGSSLTFEKRADYWQKPELTTLFSQAHVQTIVFQVITEMAQNAIALETGTADISASVSGDDVSRFESNPKFTVFKFQDNLIQMLGFNGTAGGPFATNKDLRQAVAYAIDRKAMCAAVAPGACTPLHTVGNSNFGGYQTKWDTEPYYEFDLAKAKSLFASSGAKPGLMVKLLCQNDARSGLMAQIIQADLALLGITVNIDQEEPAVYNTISLDPKAYDLIINAGAGGDFVISPWLLAYDQNHNNGTTGDFFKDDKLQSLLETASSIAGYTPANIDAFNQYQKDQLYDYGLLSFANNVVSIKSITKVARDTRGQIVPGACEYSK